ncbi:GH92 family glycosyl hydrolase [Asticcacaulis sp. EMRT-3]|uniref:GH92 family glycosyl hydrolase n=1 Tax=Asticcacaulis sp. EMRT-3 TaxID=3040349 RepID=UPI0024AFBA1E|nr:GH92 family glycosyl hydrolase [Asticcacaulis sp. EMRT-3]MDI7775169.1 GH92 family glycosyl hydrolase [Asticcacaulis sp. EMRT-3]
MLDRRALLASIAAAGLAAALPRAGAAQSPPWSALVDPMIGTGGHGHVYPGATVPFGMVQLSPDTDNARWDACSGYYHDDATLLGFSHTHLSGTGASDMLDLLVVPQVGAVKLDPGTLAKPAGSYRTRLDHTHEVAEPGYYSLLLPDEGILAELTASARAGMHRYSFPTGKDASLLIDWAHGFRDAPETPTRIATASLELRDATTLVGARQVQQWAYGRWIYFALKLSQPVTSVAFFSDDTPAVAVTTLTGRHLKVVLNFGQSLERIPKSVTHVSDPDARKNKSLERRSDPIRPEHALSQPLIVKVGISAVDIDGALQNLQADMPDFDFDGYRAKARAAWEPMLSTIRIDTPDRDARRIFYAAMYHAHLAPTLFYDQDGRYRGMDSAVHTVNDPLTGNVAANFSTYSLWDTYRAWHPLMTIIAPDRAAGYAENLIVMASQSPSGPCVWPLQGIETSCMIGWHSAVVIAEAIQKRLPGVNAQAAWAQYRPLAFTRPYPGLQTYRDLGYIPADQESQSVSKTLEYAYDDWAMAHIAHAAGADEDARALRARSGNYRNVFDPTLQFVRPRLRDGSWAMPFDPRSMGHDPKRWWDYTESNAWQATFLNQHDLYSYIGLFGGDAAFIAKLDALFEADSSLPADAPPDMDGMIGQYVHGNEPSHHIAYLYAYAGAPWKTQMRIRQILKSQYRAAPDGMAGNEDCGQMSAWYILSSLGFYPVDPVSGVYVLGAPLFPSASIALPGGKSFRITSNTSDRQLYIRSVTLNGRPHSRSWISHDEIMAGGALHFNMGDTPNTAFGQAPADRPPSFQPL